VSILKASKLGYYYQDGDIRRFILKNTNISFERGRFYTIVGQSGSGKTTLGLSSRQALYITTKMRRLRIKYWLIGAK